MKPRQSDPCPNFVETSLDVLPPEAAWKKLAILVGEERISRDIDAGKAVPLLFEWLSYHPLGLELVGRYVAEHPDLSFLEMLKRLKEQGLSDEVIGSSQQSTLNPGEQGIKAALELSWLELDPITQQISHFLSLFAPTFFRWQWVESASQWLFWEKVDLDWAKKQLYQWHLLQGRGERDDYYQIHPLVREFLREKLQTLDEPPDPVHHFSYSSEKYFPEQVNCNNAFCAQRAAAKGEGHPTLPICPKTPLTENNHITEQPVYFPIANSTSCQQRQKLQPACSGFSNYRNECDRQLPSVRVDELRQAFVATMMEIVQQIPDSPTPKDIKLLEEAIPHLQEIAQVLQAAVKDEDLLWGFDSLGKFYQGQGLEDLLWLFDRLGRFYQGQRLYGLAEPWFVLCLSVAQAGFGDDHLDVGTTLNNLAGLYYCQGRYSEAELLYLKALELRKRLLGNNHSDVATTMNNLGLLYYAQGRYSEAEPLYRQVLELRIFFLGNNHPDVAATLNNLGLLYYAQGRYSEAEPLYLQALELRKRILGNNHPDVAATLNNLAGLYNSQGRYQEAQPLYLQALQLSERVLGIYHPNTVIFRKNLSILQAKIGGSSSWLQKLFYFRF